MSISGLSPLRIHSLCILKPIRLILLYRIIRERIREPLLV